MTETTVLITGATGFVGGAFQARALAADESSRYLLMVRARSEGEARTRVRARLQRFVGAPEAERWLARSEIVCADLEDPESLDQPLFDRVTHVVHAGANTSFIAGQAVWDANYHGTIALARRVARAPGLERFVYVGTAMICGNQPPHVVVEDAYPAVDAAHLVEYTRAKAAAEGALREEVSDLPWVVARPSIIVGHSRLGCGPSGSIFWVFRALDRLGLICPDPERVGIDVVPVDWVADALAHLLHTPTLQHRTYHLSAGLGARTRLDQLVHAFAQARGSSYSASSFTQIASADITGQRKRIAAEFGKLHGRRMEMALALYLSFCELDVAFDNTRILQEGIAAPLPLTEYLNVCLNNPRDVDIVQQAADEL